MVQCKNKITNNKEYNFHARVLENGAMDNDNNNKTNNSLKAKLKFWSDKQKETTGDTNSTKITPINVMILVLDSTSRNDAFRNLPRTMDFLTKDLNFTEFKKYNCLGEPTMYNAIPLLTGIQTSVLYKNKGWRDAWDNQPLIWKNFDQSHYATAYIEDLPSLGTFNYGGQRGFVNPPTTFYMRPFFSAYETSVSRENVSQLI